MNLAVFFQAPLATQIHVYAALLAFMVGATVLWRRKGTSSHKRWGKIWVGLMVVTALTSFFIHEIRLFGPFSPIHLVSIGTLVAIYFAVKQARAGNITDHQRSMKGTFIGAMGVAGVLAFMPGRMMFEVALEPTLEKLFTGSSISAPAPLFSGDWQIPVITVSIVLLVAMWKPIYQFLGSKWA